MLFTDVYTASHFLERTTASVYRLVHLGQADAIHSGKKWLIPLRWVAERTGVLEEALASQIRGRDRLCLLDIPHEEVDRLEAQGKPERKKSKAKEKDAAGKPRAFSRGGGPGFSGKLKKRWKQLDEVSALLEKIQFLAACIGDSLDSERAVGIIAEKAAGVSDHLYQAFDRSWFDYRIDAVERDIKRAVEEGNYSDIAAQIARIKRQNQTLSVCVSWLFQLIAAALDPEQFKDRMDHVKQRMEKGQPSWSARVIRAAAEARGIANLSDVQGGEKEK